MSDPLIPAIVLDLNDCRDLSWITRIVQNIESVGDGQSPYSNISARDQLGYPRIPKMGPSRWLCSCYLENTHH